MDIIRGGKNVEQIKIEEERCKIYIQQGEADILNRISKSSDWKFSNVATEGSYIKINMKEQSGDKLNKKVKSPLKMDLVKRFEKLENGKSNVFLRPYGNCSFFRKISRSKNWRFESINVFREDLTVEIKNTNN